MTDNFKNQFLNKIQELKLENSTEFIDLKNTIINKFVQSGSFDTADYYAGTIKFLIEFLTEEDIKFILEQSLQNRGGYGNSNQLRTQNDLFISLCSYSYHRFPSLYPDWIKFIENAPKNRLKLDELDKLNWVNEGNKLEKYPEYDATEDILQDL